MVFLLKSYGYDKSLLLRKLKRIGLFDTNNETNTMTTAESNNNNKSNFLISNIIFNKFLTSFVNGSIFFIRTINEQVQVYDKLREYSKKA